MIKQQFSGLFTWKLKRSIFFSTDPIPKMVKTSGGGGRYPLYDMVLMCVSIRPPFQRSQVYEVLDWV